MVDFSITDKCVYTPCLHLTTGLGVSGKFPMALNLLHQSPGKPDARLDGVRTVKRSVNTGFSAPSIDSSANADLRSESKKAPRLGDWPWRETAGMARTRVSREHGHA